VNADVDAYTETPNCRKILGKAQKNSNLPKTNRVLKPKYNLSAGQVFTFYLPWGRRAPMPPSVTPLVLFTLRASRTVTCRAGHYAPTDLFKSWKITMCWAHVQGRS